MNRDKNSYPQIIKSVIKAPNGMVLVFDDKGVQISKYQGQVDTHCRRGFSKPWYTG